MSVVTLRRNLTLCMENGMWYAIHEIATGRELMQIPENKL